MANKYTVIGTVDTTIGTGDLLVMTDGGWSTVKRNWNDVDITGFSAQERQYVPGKAEVKPRLQKCTYCGSRCEDIRGNCGACGAPFEDEWQPEMSAGSILADAMRQPLDAITRMVHEKPPHVEHGKKY